MSGRLLNAALAFVACVALFTAVPAIAVVVVWLVASFATWDLLDLPKGVVIFIRSLTAIGILFGVIVAIKVFRDSDHDHA